MQLYIQWVLACSSVLLLLSAASLLLMRKRHKALPALPADWALTARPVFSQTERCLYRLLREALPQQIILCKLPLLRFCQPTDPKRVHYWYSLLGASHVSFAICSSSGRVLAAVDLLGPRAPSRRATIIKQSVLTACRVKHLSCTAERLPSLSDLQMLITPPGAAAASRSTGHAAKATRRERRVLWQDSGFMQDSFFRVDARSDIVPNPGLGTWQEGDTPRDVPVLPDDIGGVVVDTPVSPLRH